MPKVTVEQYAKHRKIAGRSVRRYLASGLIPEAARIHEGRFLFLDQAKADKALAKNATTMKQLATDNVLPSIEKTSSTEVINTTLKAGTAGLSFHDARTLSQRYKAALLKIELEERTGKLIDAEKVKAAAFALARTVRDAILNIPDRCGAVLAAESDQMKVAAILTGELKQALEELSK